MKSEMRYASSPYNYIINVVCVIYPFWFCSIICNLAISHTTSMVTLSSSGPHLEKNAMFLLDVSVFLCVCMYVCLCQSIVPAAPAKTVPPTAGLIRPVHLLWAAIHPSQTPYLIVWKPCLDPANCRLIQGSAQERNWEIIWWWMTVTLL